MKRIRRAALACAFSAFLGTGNAGAQGYSKPPLRIFPAESVITTPSAYQTPYRLGDELDLIREANFPQAAVKDLTETGFEVRLFRIDDGQSDPKPWYLDQDHCDIFLSLVFKHLKFRGDRVPLGPLEDIHWLAQTPEGFFEPGHFLLVVEQDSAADELSERNHWEIFRLASAARADYFRQGVRIEIDPQPGAGSPVTAPNQDAVLKQALDAVARAISAKFNCYQAQPVSTATNGQSAMVLASCVTGAPQTPG